MPIKEQATTLYWVWDKLRNCYVGKPTPSIGSAKSNIRMIMDYGNRQEAGKRVENLEVHVFTQTEVRRAINFHKDLGMQAPIDILADRFKSMEADDEKIWFNRVLT